MSHSIILRVSALSVAVVVLGACAPSWIPGIASADRARRTVEGRVTFAPSGAPFQDVWVSTLSGSDSVQTDGKGRFVLVLPAPERAVRIEHVGYGTLIIPDLDPEVRRTHVEARLDVPPLPSPPPRSGPPMTIAERVALVGEYNTAARNGAIVDVPWSIRDLPRPLRYVIVSRDSLQVGIDSLPSGFKDRVDHIESVRTPAVVDSYGTAARAGVMIISLKKSPPREE
jgi:hypothetical protein